MRYDGAGRLAGGIGAPRKGERLRFLNIRLSRLRRLGAALLCVALLSSALVASAAADTSAADWPTFLHDPQRTAASPAGTFSTANAFRLTKHWSFQTQSVVAPSPTIVDGVVYVGSWDGYEYALDANTGALKWKTYLGVAQSVHCGNDGITSAAAVQNGMVYVGGGDGYWYALNAANGSVAWKLLIGSTLDSSGYYNWASPLIYNGSVYIGTSSYCDNPLVQGQLWRVDLTTHVPVAVFNIVPAGVVGGAIWTSPTVDPATNTIYLTTGTKVSPLGYAESMVALDATTLALKSYWQLPAALAVNDSDWGTTPILFTDAANNPLVAAVNKDGLMFAFRRSNLAAGPVWVQSIAQGGESPEEGDGSVSSAAFGQGLLFQAGGDTTINGVAVTGSVRALDPGTGRVVWQHASPDVVIASVAYTNGLVFAAGGATLEVLNASTGAVVYSTTTGGRIYGAPALANGQVYFGSRDGNVYAYGLSGPTTVGGGAFRLADTPYQTAALSWDGGAVQTSYLLARTPALALALPAAAATFVEQGLPNGQLDCYQLLSFWGVGLVGQSDVLCNLAGSRSAANAPPQVGVALNQSNTALVTWTPAPSADSYLVFALPQQAGAAMRVLPVASWTLGIADNTGGAPTCYVVATIVDGGVAGNSDIMCALPGQASFLGSRSVLTAPATATASAQAARSALQRQTAALHSDKIRADVARALAAHRQGAAPTPPATQH